MTINVMMHPKPMKRHTAHVAAATADIAARLPGEHQFPGIHIRLYPQSGGLQTVIVPEDQLDELLTSINALRATAAR